ncbi:MAG: flagellar filament capping protein FliD, partial [Planctomycetota bacterium]
SYQLVLASLVSGEEGRLTDIFTNVGQTGGGLGGEPLTLDYSAPDGDGVAQSDNNITVGNDALAEVNGILVRRSTNSLTEVLQGVTIDLRAQNQDGPITIAIDSDKETVRGNIDEFVTAYNRVIDFLDTQSTFTPSNDEDDNGGTTGALFGDSLISSVRRSIQSALFDVDVDAAINDTEGFSTLAQIGIEQDSDGKLSVDATVFDEKFADNIDRLMDLFADTDGFDNGDAEPNTPDYFVDTTADSGLMDKLVRNIDQMFGSQDSGDSDFTVQGIFDLREEAIQGSIERYNDRIEERESRLESFEQRLILQYANLEEVMAGLNAQSAALNAALNG